MSEIKLLPCPFCGGEVEMAVDSVDAYSNAYTFCCDDCYMYTAYQFSNEKEAIEHWNTRKPIEQIVEKLEKLHSHYADLYESTYYDAVDDAIDIVKDIGDVYGFD